MNKQTELDNVILVNDTFLVRLIEPQRTGSIYLQDKIQKAEIVKCNRVNEDGSKTPYQQGDLILLNPNVDYISTLKLDNEVLVLCKKENILLILNRNVT